MFQNIQFVDVTKHYHVSEILMLSKCTIYVSQNACKGVLADIDWSINTSNITVLAQFFEGQLPLLFGFRKTLYFAC